jgi:hypothetical protein
MNVRDPSPCEATALSYAQRGWSVFPCHTVGDQGCSCRRTDCGSPGKHPRIAGGLNAASADPEAISRWWSRWPSANVAVCTGAVSGLVVVDIDPDHGGVDTLRKLVDSHGPLTPGPLVRTGSGGWHAYFRHPGDAVRNSAGTRLGAGVDVRGDGGYVIAPPSRHASGRHYTWDVTGEPPALDGWLLHRLLAPQHIERAQLTEPIRLDAAVSAWARSALDDEATRVRAAPSGSRNHTLNRAAFCLGQIVGAGVLDPALVERTLTASALAVGLSERESVLTIRSGLRAGTDHPRGPRGHSRPAPTRSLTAQQPPDAGMDIADSL